MTPSRSPHPCGHVGCRRLVLDGSRCHEHARQEEREREVMRRRNPAYVQAQEFYRSREWRATREAYLRANPDCSMCLAEGRENPAVVVDHVQPISRNGDRLSWSNLRGLCSSHHSARHAADGSRWGNR